MNILEKKVISIIRRYKTHGHSPYLVLSEDYEKYVLKAPSNKFDKDSIIKEFLCSFFLKIWGINVPECAILSFEESFRASSSELSTAPFSYSKIYFGSKFIDNAIDLQHFITFEQKRDFKKILNPDLFLLLIIFDIWVENDDRKPSNNNLLMVPNGDDNLIIPIDHAYTFSSLSFGDLKKDFVSYSANESIRYSNLGITIVKQLNITNKELASLKERFYICVEKTWNHFDFICEKIPHELGWTSKKKTIFILFYSARIAIKKY